MELWIRNQSKKSLLKIEDIYYEENGSKYVIVGNNHWLGDYSTEKQTLEVLDEIQKGMVQELIVYQMPEDKGENYVY